MKRLPAESFAFRRAGGMPPLLAMVSIVVRYRGYPWFPTPEIVQAELMEESDQALKQKFEERAGKG